VKASWYAAALNFFAHACVARHFDPEPRFVLGSMLPDLATMVASRHWTSNDERVTAGARNHHRADSVFHDHPVFVQMCAQARDALRSDGLARGPTLAVAHVGIELLIDGELAVDREAVAAFEQSLVVADDPSLVQWGEHASTANYQTLVRRLRSSALPTAYRDVEAVAPQLQRMLARRPRLAMAESDVPIVARWLARVQPEVARHARDIVHAVIAGVEQPAPSPSSRR